MRYSQYRDFLLAGLVGTDWEDVFMHPGPDDENTPPGRFVMLTVIGGPGFNTEMIFDGKSFQVMVAGEQNDFDDAEGLAYKIDEINVSSPSQAIGGLWSPQIYRQGGPPTPLIVDDADRHRWTCNYVVDAQSAIAG